MLFQSWFQKFSDKGWPEKVQNALAQKKMPYFHGVWGSARAYVAASLLAPMRQPAVLLAPDEASAMAWAEELRFFLQGFPSLSDPNRAEEFHVKYPTLLDPANDPLVYFPAWEVQAVDSVNREHGRNVERLLILRRLAKGEPFLLVTTVEALCQAQAAPEALMGSGLTLLPGREYRLDELAAVLVRLGYRREAQVEEAGQFAIRGGLLDVAVPDQDAPIRAEFFGDTLEELRSFDPSTQKSIASLNQLEVMPFHEILIDEALRVDGLKRILSEKALKKDARQRWHDQLEAQSDFGGLDWLLGIFFPQSSLFDYLACLKQSPLFFIDQPQLLKEKLIGLREDHNAVATRRMDSGLLYPTADAALLNPDELFEKLRQFRVIGLSLLKHSVEGLAPVESLPLAFKGLELAAGDLSHLKRELMVWLGQGWQCLLAAHSHGELTRLKTEMEERLIFGKEIGSAVGMTSLRDLDAEELGFTLGHVSKGFAAPDLGLVLISDQEALRREALRSPSAYRHRFKGLKGARKIESFAELQQGQYAVHVDHGIGLYQGVVRLNVDGFEKDFVCLEYTDKEKLYVPVDQVDKIQKYLGGLRRGCLILKNTELLQGS